jgi:hypothetical protein
MASLPSTLDTTSVPAAAEIGFQQPVSVNTNAVGNVAGLADVADTDLQDMLKRIQQHLFELDYFKSRDMKPVDTLVVGDNRITIKCLLHFLSGNARFYQSNASECSDVLKQAVVSAPDGRRSLDLKNIIKLSQDNCDTLAGMDKDKCKAVNFLKDSKFYENLYGFDIAMLNFLSYDPSFKSLPAADQYRLLDNVRVFIKQSLQYLQAYMKRYNITSPQLEASGKDLLYILSHIYYQEANIGTNIGDLNNYYSRLKLAVDKNAATYAQILAVAEAQKAFTGPVNQEQAQVINQLIREIQAKLSDENARQLTLQAELTDIQRNGQLTAASASANAKAIADRLSRQLEIRT